MKEPVLIQHDDDVEVYNRPAASEYYHTQVRLFLTWEENTRKAKSTSEFWKFKKPI